MAYYEEGHTLIETGKIFKVGKSTVSAWVKKKKETGDLSNKPLNRSFKKTDPEKLKAYVKEHPDETQKEMAEAFGCCNQAISKALKRCGITQKKTVRYKEQNSEKVEKYLNEIKDILSQKIRTPWKLILRLKINDFAY